jgi:hypothetical protein
MNGIQNFALIVFAFLIILLMPILPMWLLTAALVLGLWKAWILRTGSGQPPRLLIMAIGALLLSFILLDSQPLFSRESSSSLVCICTLLFCLDRPHARQVMLLHSGLFAMLIAVLVMRGPPLPLFVYFFMTVLIFFSLMIHHLPPTAVFSLWPLGRNIIKIALPVSALLLPVYFFFPEFRPPANDYAVTGMSDLLEPGRIAKLAQSDRLAFRIRFLNDVPAGQALYWRGAVLEDSYGMIWRKSRGIELEDFPMRDIAGAIPYEMIPDNRMGIYLPLLEHTLAVKGLGSSATKVWWNSQLRIFQSQNEIILASASPHDRFVARQVPNHTELKIQISDRVQTLVDQIKRLSPEQQVEFILNLLRDFSYTLEPGTLKQYDALDDFLFEQKKGFCEHFAAAFASLLQLAGTPARVITGYEGGVFIDGSDFLVVRDSDAHAWTEVYLDGQWRRIDPSSVVRNVGSIESKRLWITALPAAWISYYLRIATMKLREWAEQFEYVFMILVGVLLIVVPLQIWRLQKNKRERPPWQQQMEAFLLFCRKRGIERDAHEGMRDFLQRVATHFPNRTAEILDLSALFQGVAYGPEQDSNEAQNLKAKFRDVRRLLKSQK